MEKRLLLVTALSFGNVSAQMPSVQADVRMPGVTTTEIWSKIKELPKEINYKGENHVVNLFLLKTNSDNMLWVTKIAWTPMGILIENEKLNTLSVVEYFSKLKQGIKISSDRDIKLVSKFKYSFLWHDNIKKMPIMPESTLSVGSDNVIYYSISYRDSVEIVGKIIMNDDFETKNPKWGSFLKDYRRAMKLVNFENPPGSAGKTAGI